MNVLLLRQFLEKGGASKHIRILARVLQNQGESVWVAATDGDPLNQLENTKNVLNISFAPTGILTLFRSILHVYSAIRQLSIELVHSHHRFCTLAAWPVCKLLGIPLIVTLHEFHEDGKLLARLWCGDEVIVPSQALADHLRSFYKIPAEKISVIANIIEPAAQAEEHQIIMRTPFTTACIGRLSKEKGINYFLEAVSLLKNRERSQYLVIGDGPEMDLLKDQCKELNLEKFVTFTGYREDIPSLLETIDLVVIPSTSESFSLTALEAMQAGCLIIASNVGGLPELIQDGETGFLIPPADAALLAEKMDDCFDHPDFCLQIRKKARKAFLARFSQRDFFQNVYKVYYRHLD